MNRPNAAMKGKGVIMSINTAEAFELLFDKNNKTAYKALQELQKESVETDKVYPYMDRLGDMLDSDLSVSRTGNFRYAGWFLGVSPGTMRFGSLSLKIIMA